MASEAVTRVGNDTPKARKRPFRAKEAEEDADFPAEDGEGAALAAKPRPGRKAKDVKSKKEQMKKEWETRRKQARKDEIDRFLAQVDNPDEWRTLRNPDGSEKLVLTEEELSLIARLYTNQLGAEDYNAFEPTVEFFTRHVMPTALPAATEPKRRFIPSAHEAREIARLVRAIRRGARPLDPLAKKAAQSLASKPRFYDIWAGTEEAETVMGRPNHIAAPKTRLPGHSESYNPPGEYLFTAEEEAAWRERQATPDPDVPFNPADFLPRKYGALRLVPAYEAALKERFARCLDLYLCPRAERHRVQMNPDDLLPQLPDPRDLKPFPYLKSIVYETASAAAVKALALDPTGQFLVSAQGSVASLWESATGRMLCSWDFANLSGASPSTVITSLAWNPAPNMPIVAVGFGSRIALCVPPLARFPRVSVAEEMLRHGLAASPSDTWHYEASSGNGVRVLIDLSGPVKQVVWHRKGDYFASVVQPSSLESPARAVTIHHLSRHASQQPFKKLPSLATAVCFHPSKALIFLVMPAANSVRAYNLQSGEVEKQMHLESTVLEPCLAVHSSGEHVLLGTADGRVAWFDMELTTKPIQMLASHSSSVRALAYHPRLPLCASASADGLLQLTHGQVFADSLQNPVIVPVKQLASHSNCNGASRTVGLTACVFHPHLPWIYTATVDGSISLFVS